MLGLREKMQNNDKQQGSRSYVPISKVFDGLIVLVLLLAPASALAEGNIHVGQLKIHPYMEMRESFSNNIFFTSTEERRDSYITYIPGVKLEFPFGQHKAEATYYAVATRYRTFEGENTTDHNANGFVDFKFGHLLEAKFSDDFMKGHEPRSSSATGFMEVFRHNTAMAAGIYQLANRSKIGDQYR